MKKMTSLIFGIVFMNGIVTFGAGPEKTISNLKEAYQAESAASAKYAAYAEQARKEGFLTVAALFEAASKAGAIHADNNKKVLESLGQQVEQAKPIFTVHSTIENLTDALKGTTHDFTTVYPGYISTAKSDGVKTAAKSFNWTNDTEKKQQGYFKTAIEALRNKLEASLPKTYWVCPKCGYTYNIAKPTGECGLCGTKASKYIKFGN